MPYILTKFFEKKSYQEDFIKGNFYLSSLATFTKTYAERGLMEAAAQGLLYGEPGCLCERGWRYAGGRALR